MKELRVSGRETGRERLKEDERERGRERVRETDWEKLRSGRRRERTKSSLHKTFIKLVSF